MTINSQTSRRSFLSSLAILSAGTAFGSAIDIFSARSSKPDLRKQWYSFWKQHGGKELHEIISLPDNAIINPCKGHFYKAGKVIYFPRANTLSQPLWIYWERENINPSDVVITFFKNDAGNEKILRINRFEFEAMTKLFSDINGKDSTQILNETMPFHSVC